MEDDGRDVGEGLDVVDDGGTVEQAGLKREGRLLVRLAAPALDGVHQRGFLAADERARADADFQIEIEIRAQNALAQQPRLARLMNGIA